MTGPARKKNKKPDPDKQRNHALVQYILQLLIRQFGHRNRGRAPVKAKPAMHWIFGVPCSGKSRLAEELCNASANATVLNLDFDRVYTRHPELSHMQTLIDPDNADEMGLSHTVRHHLCMSWVTLYDYVADHMATAKLDVILHWQDTNVSWDLGPRALKASEAYEQYAHFVVADPAFTQSCMENRIQKGRDVMIHYSTEASNTQREIGSTFNLFLEEYEFMVRHTPNVYFFFPATGQHLHRSRVKLESNDRGEVVIAVEPEEPTRTVRTTRRR